jgi:hypothetical protein
MMATIGDRGYAAYENGTTCTIPVVICEPTG